MSDGGAQGVHCPDDTEARRNLDEDPSCPAEIRHENPPGIIDTIGRLPAGAIVEEIALARIMKRHPVSIKRAVERGELPPPVRLLGRPVWLAGSIVAHLQKRLDAAAQDAERERRRLESHRP